MPNEVFTIKPLEWEWRELAFSHAYVTTRVFGFSALVAINKQGGWYWHTTGGSGNYCASPEEGKRLAEEHWQSYIKQALVPAGESSNAE